MTTYDTKCYKVYHKLWKLRCTVRLPKHIFVSFKKLHRVRNLYLFKSGFYIDILLCVYEQLHLLRIVYLLVGCKPSPEMRQVLASALDYLLIAVSNQSLIWKNWNKNTRPHLHQNLPEDHILCKSTSEFCSSVSISCLKIISDMLIDAKFKIHTTCNFNFNLIFVR